MFKVKKGSIKSARLLSQAVALEEYEPPHIVMYGVLIIVGLMIFATVGAAIMPVVSSANARGTVTPMGAVKPIQHLVGGSIAEIYVRDGALLEAGDPILRLSGDDDKKRFDQVDAEYFANLAEAERLRALADGREPDFTALPPDRSDLALAQAAIHSQTLQAREKQRAALMERGNQARANADALRKRIRGLRAEYGVLLEEYNIFKELFDKGYASKIRYLESRKELSRVQSAISESQSELAASEASIAESEATVAEFESAELQKVVDRLGEVSATLAQVRETRARLRGSVDRLLVVAPRGGIVHKLRFKTPGAVIAPGDVIAEIVPNDEALIVEAKILPRDVGFLEMGQKAKITVDGFDISRFSTLRGTLVHVSASTVIEDNGDAFFLANLAVDRAETKNQGLASALRPGMAVSASIVTGERSFLRYLIRPVYDSLSNVFSER